MAIRYAGKSEHAKPGPYLTILDPAMEYTFQNWVKSNGVPFDPSPTADYDMRGFFKALLTGDKRAQQSAATGHYPDVWKTPYHKTFSNESQYALPTAPRWVGDRLVDNAGGLVADETPNSLAAILKGMLH